MIRFLLVAALVVGCPWACHGAESTSRSVTEAAIASPDRGIAAQSLGAVAPFTADVNWPIAPQPVRGEVSRGSLLPSLYVGLAALNALDGYTTSRGTHGGGAVEANPLMRGVAGYSAALWAVKGGATAATVLLSERLRRSHQRAAAVATMIVSNSVVAMVTVHNARTTGIR